MNNSGDAVDQIVRISTELGEVALRLAGSGAKNLAMLILAVLRPVGNGPQKMTTGKTRLVKLLKECHAEGASIDNMTLSKKDYNVFKRNAHPYKASYAAVHDRKNKTVTILHRENDLDVINLVREKSGLAKVEPDEASRILVEPIDPAEVQEAKKNGAPEEAFLKRGKDWKEQPSDPMKMTTTDEPASPGAGNGFLKRGPAYAKASRVFDAPVVDVEVIEVPALPPVPERLALPAPEHYISPVQKAPEVIHTGPPEGHTPKALKHSVREKLYQIRATQAKKKHLTPGKVLQRKPKMKTR